MEHRVNILIVEDELLLAEDIKLRLEKLGYYVVAFVPSVNTAMEELKSHPEIDLVLIDISLRGKLDGIDLAKMINSLYKIPFIFLTSHADRALAVRAKDVHPAAYMLKPFNDREIAINIELALLNYSNNRSINVGRFSVATARTIGQKLYEDNRTTTVNIRKQLDQLVSNLLSSSGDPLEPQLEIENLEVDIDTVIPVSLIVNELVTNAVKYAYEGIAKPTLLISFSKSNDEYYLTVADNGVGMKSGDGKGDSFGLKLVRSLVNQLNGQLNVEDAPGGGTTWQIKFPQQHSS